MLYYVASFAWWGVSSYVSNKLWDIFVYVADGVVHDIIFKPKNTMAITEKGVNIGDKAMIRRLDLMNGLMKQIF